MTDESSFDKILGSNKGSEKKEFRPTNINNCAVEKENNLNIILQKVENYEP